MDYKEIEIEGMKEILRDKEKEIKKLKSDLSLVIKERDDNIEQNKKLKEENYRLGFNYDNLQVFYKEVLKEKTILEGENKKLNERIRFLEQCLDNKEKVNKQLRKDIKWYEKEEDRLREENRKLKEELEWYQGFDNYLTNHGFDMKNLKENIKNQN